MMKSLEISVIIPTYKPKDYLWECLASLDKQTLDHSLFEIIIVLNGEKEPYFSMIDNHIKEMTQTSFHLIYNELQGVSNARNLGIDKASGKAVCFIDDDDWVSDNYLENLLNVLLDSGLAISNVKLYYEKDNTYGDSYMTRAYLKNAKRDNITLRSARSLCNSACIKAIPREIIGNVRFDPHIKISEDVLFMTTVSKGVKQIKLASSDTIYFRRVRSGSATYHNHSMRSLIYNNFQIIWKLVRVFFSAPTKYNLVLFIFQGLALFKNIVRIMKGT